MLLSVVFTAGQRGDSPQSEAVLRAIRVPRPGLGGPRKRTGDRNRHDPAHRSAPRRIVARRTAPHFLTGVECTGFGGAALIPYLRDQSVTVTQVNQPDEAAWRRHGASVAIDVVAVARAVLCGWAATTVTVTATAKTVDGPVEAHRLFTITRGVLFRAWRGAVHIDTSTHRRMGL